MQKLRRTIIFQLANVVLLFPAGLLAATSGTNEPGGVTSGTNNPPSGDGTGGVALQNPLGNTTLIGLFQAILDVIMVFAVPIIVFFIIFAGFQYVTARGDTNKVESAHRALLYAVIGGVLILGAEVLLAVIGNTVESIGG